MPNSTSAGSKSSFDRSGASVIYLNREHEPPRVFSFAGGSAAAYIRKCPGKESANEDSLGALAVAEQCGVLAIADGVGGERGGARASSTSIESLQRALGEMDFVDADPRPAILNGMERANQAVMGLGIGAATTLSLVEICGDVIRPYHVGDSMMLLVGLRGRVKWQTVPHSPVGYAVESGLLDEREAIHHADRHLVSNIVGAENMRIEIGPRLTMAPRDTLVVASDGLFDNLHVSEIIEIIRKGPLNRAIQRLAEMVERRMQHVSDEPPADPPADLQDDPSVAVANGGASERTPFKPDDASILLFRRW